MHFKNINQNKNKIMLLIVKRFLCAHKNIQQQLKSKIKCVNDNKIYEKAAATTIILNTFVIEREKPFKIKFNNVSCPIYFYGNGQSNVLMVNQGQVNGFGKGLPLS